jgi:hypothetical protein
LTVLWEQGDADKNTPSPHAPKTRAAVRDKVEPPPAPVPTTPGAPALGVLKVPAAGSAPIWHCWLLDNASGAAVPSEAPRERLEAALAQCEVIEDYEQVHRSLPDCLVLVLLASGDPVHVVVAIDEENGRLFVVAVYRPSEERWQNDWRRRQV